ncbi:MAG: hypothetical protein PHI16_06300 [Methanocellales archaeon]|nr:hypothetical protein [Methanocellales archaeon]
MDKVYDWWNSLSEQEQYDLMLDWYPEAIKEDTDIDKFFGDMPDREQLWIYEKEVKNNANRK